MITETRIREALHDAAAHVEVDEDLAWQRAWLEVARQPIRRVRRMSIALAAAAVVVVAVLSWQLFTRNDSSPSVQSVTHPASSAPTAPKTLFDRLAPGDVVVPQAWISAADALAAARGNLAGTLVLNSYNKSAPQTSTGVARFGFATDAQGRFRVDEATLSSFALAGGSTVQIDTAHKKVNVDIVTAARDAGAIPNSPVDHTLHAAAWMQETLTNNNDLGIVYLGRSDQDGHAVLRFNVKFGSHVTFSELGWDLALDARTGVLLSAVMHYSSSTLDREVLTVEGFDDHAAAVLTDPVMVPGGFSIAAAADGTPVRGLVVPAGGETIAALLAQVRAAAP